MPRVSEFLRLLTGKATALKPAKEGLLGQPGLPGFAGLYTADGETAPEGVILLDFTTALGLSGAFMATPPGMTLENLKAKQCGEMVPPTVYEILNVSASLLNATGAPHVRLTEMVQFVGKPTGTCAELVTKATQRVHLEAAIPPCPASYLALARL
jgi:hypothetical protein